MTEDSPSPAVFEYGPPTLSTTVVLAAGVTVLGALVLVSLPLAIVGGVGTAVVIAGLIGARRALVTLGTTVVYGAIVTGAVGDGPVVPVVIAAAAALIGFDAGRYAVRLGQQVGAAGETVRAELRHVGTTVVVTGGVAAAGVAAFRLGPTEQPVVTLVALLVAAVLFLSGLTLIEAPTSRR